MAWPYDGLVTLGIQPTSEGLPASTHCRLIPSSTSAVVLCSSAEYSKESERARVGEGEGAEGQRRTGGRLDRLKRSSLSLSLSLRPSLVFKHSLVADALVHAFVVFPAFDHHEDSGLLGALHEVPDRPVALLVCQVLHLAAEG